MKLKVLSHLGLLLLCAFVTTCIVLSIGFIFVSDEWIHDVPTPLFYLWNASILLIPIYCTLLGFKLFFPSEHSWVSHCSVSISVVVVFSISFHSSILSPPQIITKNGLEGGVFHHGATNAEGQQLRLTENGGSNDEVFPDEL